MEKMGFIFGLPKTDRAIEGLSQWILADRGYEFKLRASRLYSDLLATQGLPFSEITTEVSACLDLPRKAVESEAKKYLPWTGLGAVYTTGYRALLNFGVATVGEAIMGPKGPLITWKQFSDENNVA